MLHFLFLRRQNRVIQGCTFQKQTLQSCVGVTFLVATHNVQIFELLGKTWIQSDSQCQISERANGHQGDLWKARFSSPAPKRAATHYGQFSHLVLVFSHEPDHCTDRMLFLDLLLPLWVFVFDHIPKSIGSKVVTKWVASSNQRTTRTSKDWNLQEKRSAQCSLQQDCSDRHGGRYEIKLRWALLTQF